MALLSNVHSAGVYHYVNGRLLFLFQTSVAVGSGWSDKDRADQPGVNTWNVDVFVQVVQDLVRYVIHFMGCNSGLHLTLLHCLRYCILSNLCFIGFFSYHQKLCNVSNYHTAFCSLDM